MSREVVEFEPVAHVYTVAGKQYPSVTQILKGVGLGQDYSKIDPEVLEWKRNIGEQIHRAIELDIMDDLGEYDPKVEPYLTAWRRLRHDMKIEPLAPEQPVFSEKYRYCGKPDLIATYDGGKMAIFDYKNSALIEMVTVGAQLFGYEIAYREWDNIPDLDRIDRFAFKFDPDGGYRVIQFSDLMDRNTFLWAVSLYHRKGAIKYV